MAARGDSKAPDTGPPSTRPGGPSPGTGHAADPPPSPAHEAQTAGPADTAPSTARAHRSDTETPGDATSGEAQTQGPPQAQAEPDARATTPDTPQPATDRGLSPGGHTRNEDSFDAFMNSCRSASLTDPAATVPRSHQEPRGDHTEPARGPPREPLALSHQAHRHRDYAALGARTENTAGDPGADKEMTEASGPQESGGPPPTSASHPMTLQQEPSAETVPEGHPDTAPGHTSPTGTTPDQDQETMPPPPPRPP